MNSIIQKDCCQECKGKKIKESNLINYGKENVFQIDENRQKYKETMINKYGVDHSSKLSDYNDKVANTTLERYGVSSIFKSKIFKEKRKQTNLIKYDCEIPTQNKLVREKIKNTMLDRYGVEYPLQNKDILNKTIQTLYRNGTCKTSSQQLDIFNLLKDNNYIVELNYPVSRCSLDVALFIDDIKIDIEYDCCYWHKDKVKDRKRDEFLKTQDWKVLRIKSKYKIPSLKQIEEGIFKLVNTDRTFTQIVLDDWKEKINNFKEEF